MKTQKRPIAVDLFAGAGGMTLGFEQAGFDVLAAVEIDPIHCATHEYNFPFWKVFCQSIETLKGLEIRQNSEIGDREIDVVFGGPPCQGFSLMGKRAFDDPRNSLMFHFIRLVDELQPKYFVLENVPGLTVGKHRQFITEIIDKLQSQGYQVLENYQVLNASYYGVPQDRSRLFILGSRQDLPLPGYPQPITKSPKVNPKIDNKLNNFSPCPTVWDAIGDLPTIEQYPELFLKDYTLAEYQKPSSYAQLLRGLLSVKDNFSYPRIFDQNLLTCSLRSRHSPTSTARFEATEWGKTEKISRFHKLHPQGLCNTLRAGTPSNRGAFTSPRPIHPYTPRCITVREAARLHSYPDWFRFQGTKWHGFRQVGNSVPPLLAKAVAGEIIKILGIIPSQPTEKKKLGDDALLYLNLSQAAKLYNVDPHVIEPRKRKNQSK
ncbi:DNA cytosine methyltransferase [Planktothrix paucivesiculata]|uniref:Cytosine-specific methyltransferase n=1 Tax=Planktothrix paucivesiculata PCC 9631 TaxID=671071 RepID=A0A7Z9BWW1_9CYAN|nr:DNA cytosine methyltransferase [Planktothrix paucivesiculata]VXD24144.1 Modification methylase XorII [Planktothrix paucivesiculata PCC 9631]